MTWVFYGLGIGLAGAIGWWLRGLRDEDRAHKAAIAQVEAERWAGKNFHKLPKDHPKP